MPRPQHGLQHGLLPRVNGQVYIRGELYLKISHQSFTMKCLSVAASLLVFGSQVALANFHILQGYSYFGTKDQGQRNEVSYAPSNKYNCGWLGGAPVLAHELGKSTIQQPTDNTFTAKNPICGVSNMVFHRRASGGFTLTDAHGSAGECYPIGKRVCTR